MAKAARQGERDAGAVFSQALLQLGDVARPVGDPLLDRRLGRDEPLTQALGRDSLPLGDVAAAFLCDPPLLLRELRQGIGSLPGQRVLELLGAHGKLVCHDLVERGLAPLGLAFEQPLVGANLLQNDRARRHREHGDDRCDDGDDDGGSHPVIVGALPRERRRSTSKPG